MNNKHYFLKIFHAFNFRRVTPATKIFNAESFLNYGMFKMHVPLLWICSRILLTVVGQ